METKRNIIYILLFIEAGLANLLTSIFDYILPGDQSGVMNILKYVIYAVIFIAMFILFIGRIRKIGSRKMQILLLAGLPLILMIPEIYNCFALGFTSASLWYLIKFIIFVIPFYFMAVCIVEDSTVDISFVRGFKYAALVSMPFYLFYIIRLEVGTGRVCNFGTMTYMDLAYFVLPVFIGCVLELILLDSDKKGKIISAAGIFFTAYFILCTGTRGAILVLVAVAVMMLLYTCLFRKERRAAAALLLLVIVAIMAFSLFVWQLENARLSGGFCYELFEVHDYENEINMDDGYLESVSRLVLFRAAFYEFMENPVFGGGFYYFTNKYETYPHNAVLELMSDTGIVGTAVFVAMIFAVLIFVWKHMKRKDIASFIMLTLPYTASYMVSGSVYMHTMITLYLTVGFMLIMMKKKRL